METSGIGGPKVERGKGGEMLQKLINSAAFVTLDKKATALYEKIKEKIKNFDAQEALQNADRFGATLVKRLSAIAESYGVDTGIKEVAREKTLSGMVGKLNESQGIGYSAYAGGVRYRSGG